jgi:hypothetical protein
MMVSKKNLSNRKGVKKEKSNRNQVSKKKTIGNEVYTYAIRLKKGAKIIQSLEEFALKHENEIGFADFSMIGSVEEVKLVFSLGYGKDEGGYHPVLLPTSSKAKSLKTSPGQMELLPS